MSNLVGSMQYLGLFSLLNLGILAVSPRWTIPIEQLWPSPSGMFQQAVHSRGNQAFFKEVRISVQVPLNP